MHNNISYSVKQELNFDCILLFTYNILVSILSINDYVALRRTERLVIILSAKVNARFREFKLRSD